MQHAHKSNSSYEYQDRFYLPKVWFGQGWTLCVCVCVCMESCLGMDFKRANELLKEQWSCDSFEEGKAQG